MAVSTFVQSDFATQTGATYFPIVDGDVRVMGRVAAAFAPHQTPTPSMAVAVDAGALVTGGTLVEVAAQVSQTITAPAANPRVDRVVADRATGTISVVTGTEAASPMAPALPAGRLPLASVLLQPGTTAVTNAIITDERVGPAGLAAAPGSLIGVQRFTSSGTYVPTPGTASIIVEVQGAGGGGGGSASPSSSQAAAGGGGGGGAFARSRITAGFDNVAVTVGTGGAATSAGPNAGNAGGASSFDSFITAAGGTGGPAGVATTPPGSTFRGGSTSTPTGGSISNQSGMTGEFGAVFRTNNAIGGSGGTSALGAGGVGSANFSGGTPTNFGGGGGGGSSNGGSPAQAGGGGAPGAVIVFEYS